MNRHKKGGNFTSGIKSPFLLWTIQYVVVKQVSSRFDPLSSLLCDISSIGMTERRLLPLMAYQGNSCFIAVILISAKYWSKPFPAVSVHVSYRLFPSFFLSFFLPKVCAVISGLSGCDIPPLSIAGQYCLSSRARGWAIMLYHISIQNHIVPHTYTFTCTHTKQELCCPTAVQASDVKCTGTPVASRYENEMLIVCLLFCTCTNSILTGRWPVSNNHVCTFWVKMPILVRR